MPNRQRSLGNDTTRLDRRHLLATLGAATATGLAGCGGDDATGTDDDGDEEDNIDPATEDPADDSAGDDQPAATDNVDEDETNPTDGDGDDSPCLTVDDGYTTFDPGNRRLIFRGEYPSAYEGKEINYSSDSFKTVSLPFQGFEGDFNVNQKLYTGDESADEFDGYERMMETEFDGQTVVVGRNTDPYQNVSGVVFEADFTVYSEIDGEEQGFVINIRHEFRTDNPTPECETAVEASVRHAFEVLEWNPNTTVSERL